MYLDSKLVKQDSTLHKLLSEYSFLASYSSHPTTPDRLKVLSERIKPLADTFVKEEEERLLKIRSGNR